jgi:hypothetical protein
LFAPERGGSYDIFKTRVMGKPITAYSIFDVLCLPYLCAKFVALLSPSVVENIWNMSATLTDENFEKDLFFRS